MRLTDAQKRVMEQVRDEGTVEEEDWRSVVALEQRGLIRWNELPDGRASWLVTNAGTDTLKEN